MRPFDPRLSRRIPAVRRPLGALALIGVALATTVIGQAAALAAVLVAAVAGRLDRAALLWFIGAVASRAALLWLQGIVSARTAATVKAQLRAEVLRSASQRGPVWLSGQRAGSLATLVGRGLDALDPYFTGYLPQLILGVTVPLAVLASLFAADWSSALIVLVTLPLIPIFAALVGWQTKAATQRQWRRLSTLGGHFLDMVTGLPTLRVFGRARSQAAVVRRMADAHRAATMRTLRIAFLSALILELVATLSIALVAVPVGLRVLAGGLTLQTALFVLLLAPEAYLPLRAAGARFHASAEGLTALDEALSLDANRPEPAPRVGGIAGFEVIRFEGVSVNHARGPVLRDISFELRAGERVALIGPSGAGKSTILAALLGFVTPAAGRITVDGVDLRELDLDAWRRLLAWVPQRPHLFAAALRENVALGTGTDVLPAIRAAVLDEVVAGLPDGLDTVLGERGYGLSSGQRQRVALARAFHRDPQLLLLDEPTARLDGASEAAVLVATQRLAAGRTALLVAHRPALLAGVDRVLRIHDGQIRSQPVSDGGSRGDGDSRGDGSGGGGGTALPEVVPA